MRHKTYVTATQYALYNKATGKYYNNMGRPDYDCTLPLWKESKALPPDYSMRDFREDGLEFLADTKQKIAETISKYALLDVKKSEARILKKIRAADHILVKITVTHSVEEVS